MSDPYSATALSFARHLAERDYESAYRLTAAEYRDAVTLEAMRERFEEIVPDDWGEVGPIEVGQTMDSWPQKRENDKLWAYVSLGGDVYSEAVTVIVTSERGEPRVREVEFGRP